MMHFLSDVFIGLQQLIELSQLPGINQLASVAILCAVVIGVGTVPQILGSSNN